MVEQQPPIEVLIVDDEDICRYGLNAILCSDSTLEVVGEAANGKEAIAKAKLLQPDVVLMDINMPVMDGVTATREICQALPKTKVLILTTHKEDKYLVEAMQLGACGYLLKNTPPADFSMIIRASYRGYMQLGPSLGEQLSQQLTLIEARQTEARQADSSQADNRQPGHALMGNSASFTVGGQKGITPREEDVLQLIAEGASNREISRLLHIAEKTVKNHVSSMLRRVDLRDRTQLAIWANTVRQDLTQDIPQKLATPRSI